MKQRPFLLRGGMAFPFDIGITWRNPRRKTQAGHRQRRIPGFPGRFPNANPPDVSGTRDSPSVPFSGKRHRSAHKPGWPGLPQQIPPGICIPPRSRRAFRPNTGPRYTGRQTDRDLKGRAHRAIVYPKRRRTAGWKIPIFAGAITAAQTAARNAMNIHGMILRIVSRKLPRKAPFC